MSTIRLNQERQKLREDVNELQQTVTLLVATVQELKVAFPQFEEMLTRLEARIPAPRKRKT